MSASFRLLFKTRSIASKHTHTYTLSTRAGKHIISRLDCFFFILAQSIIFILAELASTRAKTNQKCQTNYFIRINY
ncbi:unnamed protein product [Rotaria socialis]